MSEPVRTPDAAPGEQPSAPELSVVVPVYNEEESVAHLHRAVVDALTPAGLDFELLFVDDGSRDSTFTRCVELARQDRRIRVVKLRRNAGQTQAMVAGIEHARGRTLVTMDGDLQNDPRDIPTFLAKIEEGYDLVVGWRHRRKDPFWSRRLPSIIANWLIGKVTGVPIRDNGCSLKAYRAKIAKRTPLYAEMHRFIPAMMSLHGIRIAQLKVRHHARKFGSSKYGLSRAYKVSLDLIAIKTITGFAKRPIRLFSDSAGISAALGLVFVAAMLADLRAGGPPSIVFLAVAMLFGLLAVFLLGVGVLGHLVFRTAPEAVAEIHEPAARDRHDRSASVSEEPLPWHQPSYLP
jgi:glycosyltransferase involved in cell wall biosynthesis